MKKLLAGGLSLALLSLVLMVLPGCQVKKHTGDSKKLKIVATIFPQYDFARQIAGEHAEVTMLLVPGAESHSYEPTPQDIRTVEGCDLFIYVGSENDDWIEGILASMGDKKPATLKLLDCVQTMAGEDHDHGDHDEHDHDAHDAEAHHDDHEHEGHHHHEIDEHVWTSPKNAMQIVQAMSDLFCQKDSANAADYQKATQKYLAELAALDAEFTSICATATEKTLVFGDRFPLRYFARDYGLDYLAAFCGCSTDTEASAATIAALIDIVKDNDIPVVFYIEFSNQKIADTICEATGAQKRLFHSCHNVSRDELAKGETYLSLMHKNAQVLQEALKKAVK